MVAIGVNSRIRRSLKVVVEGGRYREAIVLNFSRIVRLWASLTLAQFCANVRKFQFLVRAKRSGHVTSYRNLALYR